MDDAGTFTYATGVLRRFGSAASAFADKGDPASRVSLCQPPREANRLERQPPVAREFRDVRSRHADGHDACLGADRPDSAAIVPLREIEWRVAEVGAVEQPHHACGIR